MIQKKEIKLSEYSLIFLTILLFTTSCVTNRKIQYLQEADSIHVPAYSVVERPYYEIQAGDELYINVVPFDPELRETFTMDDPNARTNGDMEASLNLQSYPVFKDGSIDYPTIGKVQMAGLNIREAWQRMDSLLVGPVFPAAKVTVKLINNYVSLVGDVKRPGKYIIYKENLNIFQALALGGDISTFGDRTSVRIVRHTPTQTYIKTFDLRSDEIMNSEYYYIQPNDVIYVSKIKGQFFGMDSFADFVSLISGSLSILVISLTLWK